MKVVLILAAVVGLCAVVEAGSIGFGSSMFDRGASYQERLQPPGTELMPADFDYSIPAALVDTEPAASSRSRRKQRSSEPPLALIVLAGLGLILLAGTLRAIPSGLRRLNAMRLERGHNARRRRVKVEIRMMA